MATEVESKRDSMDAGIPSLESKLESITLEPSSSRNRPLGLADLPPSVRSKIYAHVVDTELVNLGKENVSYTHTIKDGVLQFSASRPPFPIETALFYVNKQIGKEAKEWFYKKNLFVKFDVCSSDARHAKTMLKDSGLLFATSNPTLLEQCKAYAMELTLVEKNSGQKRASVMFPAQYLPRLINFMDQAAKASGTWAPGHALFMTVCHTYDLEIARLQGDLLELFRMLTNLGAVTIEKRNLLPGYAEGLQASMTAASFNADTWLNTMGEMTDRAVEAKDKQNYEQAAQHCQSVVIAMTYAYLTRAEALHMKPDSFHKAIQRLRHTTELTHGTALRLKHAHLTTPSWPPTPSTSPPPPEMQKAATDLLAAETATSQALSIATDSPSPSSNPWFRSLPPELIPPNKAEWFTDEERGRTWFEAGLVHLALGEFLFAAGDLERAERLVGEGMKAGVGEAFERARQGIDWSVKPGMGLRRAMRVAKAMG